MHHETSNPERDLAFRLISHTNTHLFLTGKAGTGKTTFLHQLRKQLAKRMAVVAPTGIAALNAQGVTIHSFFSFPFGPLIHRKMEYKLRKEKIKILRCLDLLVIDEISMVRADLLDAIDAALRHYRRSKKPFGGVQLLMIGDLQQLPPVATIDDQMVYEHYRGNLYFTASHALNSCTWKTIELRKIYRQEDEDFIRVLNAVRNNQLTEADLKLLNLRCNTKIFETDTKGYICLMPKNQQADQINQQRLDELPHPAFTYTAKTTGYFSESAYPMPWHLVLKQGAQVMFTKNDTSAEKRYVNGLIGEITDLDEENVKVYIAQEDRHITVKPETWVKYKYTLDEERKEIVEEQEGSFTQIPLRLAWAITIHKSQGLTFDKAIIDTQNCFTHGQAYVALSRCRSLEGLVLTSPITNNDIKQDEYIRHFYEKIDEQIPQENEIQHLQKAYFLQCLDEMFKFEELGRKLHFFVLKMREFYADKLPGRVQDLTDFQQGFVERVLRFVPTFVEEYHQLVQTQEDYAHSPHLQERLKAASQYFGQAIFPLHELTTGIAFGMAATEKADFAEDLCSELKQEWLKNVYLLKQTQNHGFDLESFQNNRLAVMLGQVKLGKGKTKPTPKSTKSTAQATISKNISNPSEKAKKEHTTATTLRLYQAGKTIDEIAQIRQLVPGTILDHMALNISLGLADIRDFVPQEYEEKIRTYLHKHPESASLGAIYHHFEETIDYDCIKIVLKVWNKEQQKAVSTTAAE